MNRFWCGVVLLFGMSCGSAAAKTIRPERVSGGEVYLHQDTVSLAGVAEGRSDEKGREEGRQLRLVSPAMGETEASGSAKTPVHEGVTARMLVTTGHGDSQSLFLFGLGLFGASGLCVYRASRLKRTALPG